MKNLTASDRTSLIKLASSLPKGDETRKAILAGLKTVSKSASVKIFDYSNMEHTPAVTKAIATIEKAFQGKFLALRIRGVQGGTKFLLSSYTEGYLTQTVKGQVSTYPSVGGDFNIPFAEADTSEEVKVTVSFEILVNGDLVTITLIEPSRGGRILRNHSVEQILWHGKGFGTQAVKAIVAIADSFEYWQKRFEG